MEMLEKIARALSKSRGTAWEEQVDAARAAIEAMAEPDEEMVAAAHRNVGEIVLPDGTSRPAVLMGDDAIASYRRMVSAALQGDRIPNPNQSGTSNI